MIQATTPTDEPLRQKQPFRQNNLLSFQEVAAEMTRRGYPMSAHCALSHCRNGIQKIRKLFLEELEADF